MGTRKNVTVAASNQSENQVVNEAVAQDEKSIVTARVVKVMTPPQGDERITFVLDKEIETIDFETGEAKLSNMFGLNIYNLVNQIKSSIDYINLADTMAMGAMINPQLLALVMVGADITFTREFHASGEVRKDGESIYSRDCYVTTIKKVTTHIKPLFEKQIEKLFDTGKIVVATQVVANPFDI